MLYDVAPGVRSQLSESDESALASMPRLRGAGGGDPAAKAGACARPAAPTAQSETRISTRRSDVVVEAECRLMEAPRSCVAHPRCPGRLAAVTHGIDGRKFRQALKQGLAGSGDGVAA